MTDYTDEEMRNIILRSLNENARRMRRKYRRLLRRQQRDGMAGTERDASGAGPVRVRDRSGE